LRRFETSGARRKAYLELPLRRLAGCGPLSRAEEQAIRDLTRGHEAFAKGETLTGCDAEGLHFVLDGWACKQRISPQGRAHIFEFILPGDAIGRLSQGDDAAQYGCVALTKVITVDASALAGLDARGACLYPGVMAALAEHRRRAQARLLDHIVRLGGQKAYQAVGHLLLELYERHVETGLAAGLRFPFLTGQERLGEMLGLSEVHVNRTLGRLKADGHLLAGPGWLALPKPEELAQLVGYPLRASEAAA